MKNTSVFLHVLWIALLMVSCSPVTPSASNTPAPLDGYYVVSTQGDDANPGTRSQPWRTIQHAADSVKAGDTVIVLEGSYPAARAEIKASGTAEAPIIFKAQGMVETSGFKLLGDYLQIRGFTVRIFDCATSGYGMDILGSHFLIENNQLIETNDSGVITHASTTDGVIRYNYFYRNLQDGIEIHGTHHLVEGNEIVHPVQVSAICKDVQTDDADGLRYFGTGHIIRGNNFHDLHYGAPDILKGHLDCVQTFGGWMEGDPALNTDTLIENNFCEANSYQTEDESGNGFQNEDVTSSDETFAHGILIRNNVVLAPFCSGAQENSSFISFLNNTCISDPEFIPLRTRGLDYWAPENHHYNLQNNIFYNYTQQFYIPKAVMETGTVTLGHNLAYRSDNVFSAGAFFECDQAGNVCADPAFVDALADDYHLKPNSAAIDAGAAMDLVTADRDGVSRPLGAAYDVGAYEILRDGEPDPVSLVTATPNPTATPTLTIAPTAMPALSPAHQQIYFADFESTLEGWYTEGKVSLFTGEPKIGKQSVQLIGGVTPPWMDMGNLILTTTGYKEIAVRVSLGADSLDASERFKIYWRTDLSGNTWQAFHVIQKGDPEADGKLHELIFLLPPEAADQPQFQIAFFFPDAAADDFAYVDNLEVLGIPK